MTRYNLFDLKVPLNTKQTNKHSATYVFYTTASDFSLTSIFIDLLQDKCILNVESTENIVYILVRKTVVHFCAAVFCSVAAVVYDVY